MSAWFWSAVAAGLLLLCLLWLMRLLFRYRLGEDSLPPPRKPARRADENVQFTGHFSPIPTAVQSSEQTCTGC